MVNHFHLSFSLLLLVIFHHSTSMTAVAQTMAAAPAPPGPTNITKILEKGGQFTTLIRLLSVTQVGDQINTQLNNSNQGLTVFAPTDNAFTNLKAGTLNSLSDQEKVELVQFHVIPTFLSTSQFQTVSNPLRTQAGAGGEFPLNVTTSGNQVNISTGISDATIANAIYTDGSLAVYQVDKVLLPIKLFRSEAPAPSPTAEKPKKKKAAAAAADSPNSGDGTTVDASDAVSLHEYVMGPILAVALISGIWL